MLSLDFSVVITVHILTEDTAKKTLKTRQERASQTNAPNYRKSKKNRDESWMFTQRNRERNA